VRVRPTRVGEGQIRSSVVDSRGGDVNDLTTANARILLDALFPSEAGVVASHQKPAPSRRIGSRSGQRRSKRLVA
jgi:hypothetical protein